MVFSGRTIYNEIDVIDCESLVGIGTIAGCKARFSKKIFNQDFLLTVSKTKTGWHLSCEVGVYFKIGADRTSELDIQQGDFVALYSFLHNEELFKITCLTNYDDAPTTFDTKLDLRGKQQIVIGNSIGADIKLLDLDDSEELIKLENSGSYLRLAVMKTSLGVYVNGNRVVGITRIKNHDFISCGPYIFYFDEASLYFTNSNRIIANSVTLDRVVESESALAYPKFNRSTRLKHVLSSDTITILDPPDIPSKPTDSLLLTLLPAVIMLVLVIILRVVLSSDGGMYALLSVCTMVLGIFTSIMNYRKSQKTYRDAIRNRETTYEAYVARKRDEITSMRNNEAHTLIENYPSALEMISRVNSFSGNLFDRTLADDDFLHVRIGLGEIKARREIVYKAKDSLVLGDTLQTTPEMLANEYRNLKKAPVVVDLKDKGILGVVGEEEKTNSFLKTVVVDICTRQYSKDAMLFVVCTKEQAHQNAWMRFIPHFQKGNGLARNIACDKASCDVQFEYLYKILTQRESESRNTKFSAIVVFVLDQMGLYTHPVSKYLEKAKYLGIYFVFLTKNKEELPQYCGKLIELHSKTSGILIDTTNRADFTEFVFEELLDDTMWKLALKLAPVYCEDVSIEGNLPKSFSLFALLGIQGADDLDLNTRWQSADITKTMAAPLGLKAGDEVVVLDLHEKHHGPHGLVAGTTGSGKSEILQTYVLSMATLYAPDEVGFVIIDFKGGGMANLFADLPHLIGAITDIDGKAINRSLKSIKAEIDKRKKLFAEAKVNNIGDYIRMYKTGSNPSMTPIPHLILIIDEFAELKADQPEFMKEVISAARVGRSLGIHLILATQKPAGVIDEQIWSNSRFKLCLKVQSKSDSNEVIKSPLAAEIREPGRAYLQVGNDELFELFQSAYSGCAAQSEEMDHVKPFVLYEVDDCGRRKLIYEQKMSVYSDENESEKKSTTQLQALTNKIAQYCRDMGIKRMPSICFPPLTSILPYPVEQQSADEGMFVDIGIYDDPSNQYQGTYAIDLALNNVMIIGSAQSGKTNLLQTIIRNISSKYTPAEAVLYIIDFASMSLKNFEKLNHVGGVVTASEDEKLKNLFKLLHIEIAERKEKLLSVGVSSFAAYKETGATDMPLITLIVDNLSALKELYFKDEDPLLNICREGLSVGINVIIANLQTAGIGYRYLSNFSTRIAFFCNDSSEYSALFSHCPERLSPIPGRCLVEVEKDRYECQAYLAFCGEKEIDRVGRIRKYISEMNAKNYNSKARKIPVMPSMLTSKFITEEFARYMSKPFSLVSGLDYATIMPSVMNFAGLGLLALSGRENSGKHNWVKYSIEMLNACYPGKSKVYLLDGVGKKLAPLKNESNVYVYSGLPTDAISYMKEIEMELKKRYDAIVSGDEDVLEKSELLILILDNSDALQAISNDSAAVAAYKNIVGKYKNMNVCILAVVDNSPISYSSPELLKTIRDQRHVLFFDDLSTLKLFDMPLPIVRNFKKAIEVGDCFYIRETGCVKIKTPLDLKT